MNIYNCVEEHFPEWFGFPVKLSSQTTSFSQSIRFQLPFGFTSTDHAGVHRCPDWSCKHPVNFCLKQEDPRTAGGTQKPCSFAP